MADATATNVIPLFRRPFVHVQTDCWADVIERRDDYVVGEVGVPEHVWESIKLLLSHPGYYVEAVPGGGLALCRAGALDD